MKAATPRTFRFDASKIPAAARRIRDRMRLLCMGLTGAVEEFPWGGAGVYKVRGKIFASSDVNGAIYEVAFKPPEPELEDALALPFVRVADYVGRYGWVQASLTRTGQIAIVWPWIEAAYGRLVAGKRKGRK